MHSVKYAIRLRVIGLASRIGYLLKRPVRLLLNEMRLFYAKFAYRARNWTKLPRPMAKVECIRIRASATRARLPGRPDRR